MSPPKKVSPEMEAVLEKMGLGIIDLARSSDEHAAEMARPNYGPLPDERTPDIIEEMEMAGYMSLMMDDGGIAD